MKIRKIFRGSFFILSTLSSLLLFQSIYANTYYPEDLKRKFESDNVCDSQKLKGDLFSLLSKCHIKNDGGSDTLIENCGNQVSSDCYQQKPLGYDTARKYLFGLLHIKKNSQGNYIKDLYCNKILSDKDFRHSSRGLGQMLIPDEKLLNCEHTWPQSKFSKSFPKNLQKGDLHHLFPVDSKANSIRGNNPFAEVDGEATYNSCSDSLIGESIVKENTDIDGDGDIDGDVAVGDIYFEPPAEHKGNVARAMFYFSVRYKMPIDPVQELFLRKWHAEDPVDSEEMERNDAIYTIQQNRNPFIDYPELASKISDF